jgi:hypothetical protein
VEFFERFAWAVPKAFRDALSSCRFEDGDVLHQSRDAYDGWKAGNQADRVFLQVLFPPKSVAAVGSFHTNWNSQVKVDLYDKDGRVDHHVTTQGRLYTVLWRGHLTAFDDDPASPLGVRDLPKDLIDDGTLEKYAVRKPYFVMPFDHASNLLVTKRRLIRSVMSNFMTNGPRIIELEQLGVVDWEKYAPTVELAVFETPEISKQKLHDLIKSAVYKPSRNAKRDMFRIQAHGWLVGED